MRHIIWRNRASAILGILVMIIPFTGFPEITRDSLVVLFGFFIALFGFYYGGRTYRIEEDRSPVTSPEAEPIARPLRKTKKSIPVKEEVLDFGHEPTN